MPAFTTPLYKAIEQAGDNGLNQYPIFDSAYREHLNQRILEHYDEQEIGQESPHRFVFALHRRMCEIMPKYNQLYESQKLVIDPLNTVSISTIFESHSDNTSTQNVTAGGTSNTTSSSNADSTSTDVNDTGTTTNNRARTTNSAMPQGRLGTNKDYATSGTDVISGVDTTVDATNTNTTIGESSDVVDSESTNTTDGTGTNEENIKTTNTELGWNGSQAEMLNTFRSTFLNIDLMIINELGDLFMLLWNTSDDYENKFDRGMFGYGY